MTITLAWADMKSLHDLRRYPALMARVARGVSTLTPMDLDGVLKDVLEAELPDDLPADEAVKRLLEEGELGASRLLAGILNVSLAANAIARAAAKFTQEVDTALRDVLGKVLTLKDTNHSRAANIEQAVSALSNDAFMRELRPGRALALLRPLSAELDGIAKTALLRVRAQCTSLKAAENQVLDPDYAVALKRLEEAVRSVETLPAAERLVQMAMRLREGTPLAAEDIRSLHASLSDRSRLTRRRTEYPASLAQAVDVLAFVDEPGKTFPWVPGFDRDRARELFKTLVPRGGLYNAEASARSLIAFLGLKDISALERGTLGSTVRVNIPRPRIPAFRQGDRTYAGISLVLPARADEAIIPNLLNNVPAAQLPIVYFPGRTERLLRQQFSLQRDAPHLDNIDLLRLAECAPDLRPHALQQILLARLSVNRLKPYQKGGPVAPEMFRGRREIVEKLKQPNGGTVLFSGRMMGKSSILHKIHDDIQSAASPHRKQLSVFVSSAADDLLTPLVNRLVELQPGAYQKFADGDRKAAPLLTLSPSERKERHRRRLQNLRSLVKTVLSGSHLTILIDEADRFAAADGERPREDSVAWLLRDLEFETPGQLRIVFAGFQTIHQQALFKNGAFANWFGLEQLGPLDTIDAEALVREPFADFGFIFSSDAGVERILEFTGRHPLLIQEVCLRLMERVAQRRRNTTEDEFVAVEAGDVEAVCREDQIRDRVRQVLSLNLEDYPRLKLMVYLILFAASAATRRPLTLASFKIDDLKEVLIEFYEERFNEYFDERSIGALIQELMALGLVTRRGDSYAFANLTFANMLREDRQFEKHLVELLDRATAPAGQGTRRFVTLSEEDLERLLRPGGRTGPMLVAGLPGTARTFIAERLFSAEEATDAVLVSAVDCRTRSQFLDLLRQKLKDRSRKTTVADVVVRHDIATLAIDDVDRLAQTDEVRDLVEELADRDVRLVMFGGPDLVRAYVRVLLGLGADLVPLRRLSAPDVRTWGEHAAGRGDTLQIILDDQTSRELQTATGGYLPLLAKFADRLRRPNKREVIPDLNEIRAFAGELTPDVIHAALLAPLTDDEREVLRALHAFARAERMWEVDWEFVQEGVFPRLTGGAAVVDRWLDAYEVVRALDLVAEDTRGGRSVVLTVDGPLERYFRQTQT